MRDDADGRLFRKLEQALSERRTTESDGQLVERFARAKDEEAFAVLVRRYAPLVWGVCSRILAQEQDTEDVFQATFLVLARRAGAIHKRASVSAWLHGVAYRLAVRARQRGRNRTRHEQAAARPPSVSSPGAADALTWKEVRVALDEEMDRLPDRFRAPLVLCYLDGRTQDAAARQLGWSKATLRRRLDRGLGLLRARLGRRGLTLAVGLVGVGVVRGTASAAVADKVVAAAVTAALAFAAGGNHAVLPGAAALAERGLKTMFITKIKIAAVLVALCVLATSLGMWAGVAAEPERHPTTPPPAVADGERAPERADDARPIGAVARLGKSGLIHPSNISALSFSRDGGTLVTAGTDGHVRQWVVSTGKEIHRFSTVDDDEPRLPGVNPAPIDVLGFSLDGKVIGAVMADRNGQHKSLRAWDAVTGKPLGYVPLEQPAQGTAAGYFSFTFSPDGKSVAILGEEKGFRVMQLKGGDQLWRLEDRSPRARAAAFTPDGKVLLTAGLDPVIRLWDAAAGKPAGRLEGHRDEVTALAVTDDGKYVASGSADGTCRVWDLAARREVWRYDHPHGTFAATPRPSAIAFSPGGKAVTAVFLNKVLSWEAATGKLLHSSDLSSQGPKNYALSPDGKTLAAVQGSNVLAVVDVETGKDRLRGEGHTDVILSLALSNDGKVLATGGLDRVICLWNAADGLLLRRLRGHTGGVSYLAFAPDGKTLISACTSATGWNDHAVSAWDVTTGRELPPLDTQATPYSSVALSPDGRHLATALGDKEKTLVLHDAAQRDKPKEIRHVSNGSWLAFSPDGGTLVVPSGLGALRLCNVASGEVRVPKEADGDALDRGRYSYSGGYSPDGRLVTVCCSDGYFYLHHAETGWQFRRLGDTPEPLVASAATLGNPYRFAFSPDGKTLATAGKDGTVRLWEVLTGKLRQRLTGHNAMVYGLAFSPDGRRLYTGGGDTTVLVWDVQQLGAGGKKPDAPSAADLAGLWDDLASEDAAKAYAAIRTLAAYPKEAGPFLKERLKPAATVIPRKQLEAMIADLDSDDFATRKAAQEALRKLGSRVEVPLRRALAAQPTAEAKRRLTELLDGIDGYAVTSEELHALRAVEVLERLDTQEVEEVLRSLTKGDEGARLTRDGAAALERRIKRLATKP